MYDFDTIVTRHNINSLKWDCDSNTLPMWVADMDFKSPPFLLEGMRKRLDNGTFGYNIIPDEWYSAYQNWWFKRHHFTIEKEWLLFSIGVVASISSIVRKLTSVAENVVVQTPVYNIFFNSILNNGRNVLESKLIYENGEYRIDFHDLEAKLADPQTSLMILCNPHNPIGKIWTRDELIKIGDLAKKYNVIVLSDEIHCDLCDPGLEYIPFASLNDTCREVSITCVAPTKTFSIAGLQTSAIIVPNAYLRHKVWRGINTDEVAEGNTFAVIAPSLVYNDDGARWLDELRAYLYKNKQYVIKTLAKELPIVKVISSAATYLLWIDCSQITDNTKELVHFLHNEYGLWLCEGEEYGKNGASFIRMNIATQSVRVVEGVERFSKGIKAYLNRKEGF